MKYTLATQMLGLSLLATLTLHSKVIDEFHTKIGNVTKAPSNFCSQNIQGPLKKIANSIEPRIPNWHAEITLPLLSCALYIVSKQIVPEIQKTKNVKENCHLKTGIDLFNIMLTTARFHDKWTDKPYSFDWCINNGLNTLLLTASARSIYKTYAQPRNK